MTLEIGFNQDEVVGQFVVDHIRNFDSIKDLGEYASLGIAYNGKLIFGVIYNNFFGHDIEMSAAGTSKKWATKNILKMIFKYPFEQLKVRRVSMSIDKPNKHARKVVEKLGFKLEGIKRTGSKSGKDLCGYGMLITECKWIGV
jgi:RimJ/RimL family protein N-acetyltransferase